MVGLTVFLIDPDHEGLGVTALLGELLQTLDEPMDLLYTCKMCMYRSSD